MMEASNRKSVNRERANSNAGAAMATEKAASERVGFKRISNWLSTKQFRSREYSLELATNETKEKTKMLGRTMSFLRLPVMKQQDSLPTSVGPIGAEASTVRFIGHKELETSYAYREQTAEEEKMEENLAAAGLATRHASAPQPTATTLAFSEISEKSSDNEKRQHSSNLEATSSCANFTTKRFEEAAV